MYSLILRSRALNQLSLAKRCLYPYATKVLKIPTIAESIEEVTVSSYLKKEGDIVQEDEEILDVETHKGNFKVRSQAGGKLVKYLVDLETDVKIGADYAEIDTDAKGGDASKPKEEKALGEEKDAKQETKARTDKAEDNKATKDDKEASKKPQESQPEKAKPKEQPQTTPKSSESKPSESKPNQPSKPAHKPEQGKTAVVKKSLGEERAETREKMSRLRKTVAQRLKESQNTYAQVTTFQELDMGDIMQLRTDLGAEFQKKYNIKLGFMSFFVKAVTQTLLERPIVNSVIDDKTNEIIHRNFVDISVAVSSPKGLVVPVIRDTHRLSFSGIEQTLIDMANKAKSGELALEDMTGGTFTISNGGVFGSMLSAPIINPPQSAILGMHNIVNRPVVRNGQIVARPIMYVSMSYDHRLLDGREGASFLKRVCDLLEDPRRLLLEH